MGLEGKNVLMVIAPGNFRDEEYFDTRAELEGKGASVTTASSASGEITGMLGGKATPDIGLDDAKAGDYDAVVFVGGAGASAYFQDRKALDLARSASESGKIVAAICIAPSILANAGILRGKRATSFSSEQGNLEGRGATYTGEAVTRDGRIITGSGPSAAKGFGQEIAKALSE
jgi:protease I